MTIHNQTLQDYETLTAINYGKSYPADPEAKPQKPFLCSKCSACIYTVMKETPWRRCWSRVAALVRKRPHL